MKNNKIIWTALIIATIMLFVTSQTSREDNAMQFLVYDSDGNLLQELYLETSMSREGLAQTRELPQLHSDAATLVLNINVTNTGTTPLSIEVEPSYNGVFIKQ